MSPSSPNRPIGLAPSSCHALDVLRTTTPITILLGEQNVTVALSHADRVDVLENARIMWEGLPERFAEDAGAGLLSTSDEDL